MYGRIEFSNNKRSKEEQNRTLIETAEQFKGIECLRKCMTKKECLTKQCKVKYENVSV